MVGILRWVYRIKSTGVFGNVPGCLNPGLLPVAISVHSHLLVSM